MKDTVRYISDYLPNVVEVDMGNGKKVCYIFELFLKGSKGLCLIYKRDEQGLYGDKMSWRSVYKFNQEHFNHGSDCIYAAEYIRSDEDLAEAAKDCYAFLRKHNLCPKRSQNIGKKKKLFGLITKKL